MFIVFETMFLIGDAVWFVEPFIRNLYSYLLSTLGLQGTQLGIGVLVLVIGLGAYCFKVKNQFAYGIVHIIFAGAAGVVKPKQIDPSGQWAGPIATLIGAMYVVSRGASNIADGPEKRRVVNAPAKQAPSIVG